MREKTYCEFRNAVEKVIKSEIEHVNVEATSGLCLADEI